MNWRIRFNGWRRRWLSRWLYRPLFGESSGGRVVARTRISPATMIEHEDRLVLGDHVYIGPFNLLEASGGIVIGEGVQITSHCALVSHSSHRTQRILGAAYDTWPADRPRPGWIAGTIHVGAYSFIGPHSLLEANTRLGRGTLVCAGSFVRGEYPEFAILEGCPARIVGDSRVADEKTLQRFPELRPLYEAWAAAADDAELRDGAVAPAAPPAEGLGEAPRGPRGGTAR
jgi:acetyltransferase-like isoleucine patch superfamily enzyme